MKAMPLTPSQVACQKNTTMVVDFDVRYHKRQFRRQVNSGSRKTLLKT